MCNRKEETGKIVYVTSHFSEPRQVILASYNSVLMSRSLDHIHNIYVNVIYLEADSLDVVSLLVK